LSVQAEHLDTEHTHYAACRAAYLSRFPEAEPMTALPDFRFVLLHIRQARHIAGFGAARTIEAADFQHLLQASLALTA
jgi:putative heme iron utilization protein